MRVFSLILPLLIILTSSSATAQLKSMVNAETDTTTEQTTLLTPEIFFDSSPSFDYYSISTPDSERQELNPVFDNKISKYSLLLGRSIIANKKNLKSTHTFSPFTVSEYNRQIRQQFFMAEPTSQQRKSLPMFSW